eukprot:UN02356
MESLMRIDALFDKYGLLSTEQPSESTTLPEESTTLPEESTTLPEESTTLPEDTTGQPWCVDVDEVMDDNGNPSGRTCSQTYAIVSQILGFCPGPT